MSDLISSEDAINTVGNKHCDDMAALEDTISFLDEKVTQLRQVQGDMGSICSGIREFVKNQKKELLLSRNQPKAKAPSEECERCLMEHANEMEKLEEELALEKMAGHHWIPCNRKQPEKPGWYLVTIDGEICGSDVPVAGMSEWSDGKWLGGDDSDETDLTIAWMPMPEPYRKETK